MADNKPQTQTPQAAAAEPKRVVAALHASRIQSQEFARNIWIIHPEVGTQPEDLLSPDYWSNITHQLHQKDRIEAWSEDLKWYAEYLVLDVGRNWAKVHLCDASVEELHAFEPQSAASILPGHTIEYAGLVAKWRVIRDKDKATVKDRCATNGEAISWLTEYAKGLAR